MDKAPKRLIWLAIFTFAVSPLLSWASVLATDETAVSASLSRMIWYSGSAPQIFIAMLVMFIPMLISFFLAQCDWFTKSEKKNSENFRNRFVLGSLYRGYVGHAERRNSYDKRKHLARHNEFWRYADDIPDILPLYGIHLP
jgi:hypothetical protein